MAPGLNYGLAYDMLRKTSTFFASSFNLENITGEEQRLFGDELNWQ